MITYTNRRRHLPSQTGQNARPDGYKKIEKTEAPN